MSAEDPISALLISAMTHLTEGIFLERRFYRDLFDKIEANASDPDAVRELCRYSRPPKVGREG